MPVRKKGAEIPIGRVTATDFAETGSLHPEANGYGTITKHHEQIALPTEDPTVSEFGD